MQGASSFSLLLRLDATRARAAVTRPTAGAWIGVGLPVLLLAVGVASAGAVVRPRIDVAGDGVTLGVLLSAPMAFLAYGTLFRGGDDPMLRRLGVAAAALFRERALRLLGLAVGIALLTLVGFAAGGSPLGRPAGVALTSAVAAWATALLSLSGATRMMAERVAGQGWGCLTAGMRDRELAAAAPLVYAPLLPLIAGAVVGAASAAPSALLPTTAVVLAAAALMAVLAGRWYARAVPRFAPQALEMSFAPPPPAGSGELRVGKGVTRLVPRRVAAVWARDALVAGRRFAWATRVVWPVAALSVVALARWGEAPATRGWVAAAALLVFLIQAAAVLGLGRLERAGRRWIDRSAGLSTADRMLGRWLWGWGMSLWLAIPLSLAWGWWSGGGGGWFWLGIGGGTSLLASVASTASAGRWR